jgi:hypothetical protein
MRIAMTITVGCLLLLAAVLGFASEGGTDSRSFNGVTATFEIKTPVVKIGEDLRIVVVYRNVSDQTVSFRFFHLDEDGEIYPKGKTKPVIGGFVGEPQYQEVTLKPGEKLRFEDAFDMKGWVNLRPGAYEVRFFYHLGLLPDESRVKEYLKRYPHDGNVVPWDDRRYAFSLVE